MIVGVTSVMWWNWLRVAPPSLIRAGQLTIIGTRTPPPCVLIL